MLSWMGMSGKSRKQFLLEPHVCGSQAHLVVHRDGNYLTSYHFAVVMRNALAYLGLNLADFSTHSFRLEAATPTALEGFFFFLLLKDPGTLTGPMFTLLIGYWSRQKSENEPYLWLQGTSENGCCLDLWLLYSIGPTSRQPGQQGDHNWASGLRFFTFNDMAEVTCCGNSSCLFCAHWKANYSHLVHFSDTGTDIAYGILGIAFGRK